MTIIRQELVNRNSGWAAEMSEGQTLTLSARTIIDFVAFNAANPNSAFDQAMTKENNLSIYLRETDGLYSRSDELLMTLISDGFRGLGTHDLQFGMCGRARHKRAAEEGRLNEYLHGHSMKLPDHGCAENLTWALEDWGIKYENIPIPVNFFQNMEIDQDLGGMKRTQVRPSAPVDIVLRAEKDLLVAFSACPDMASKTGGLGVGVLISD